MGLSNAAGFRFALRRSSSRGAPPTWVTTCLGGMCEQPDGSLRHMVTKTAFRFLHTLRNLGCSPEPNLTVLWSSRLPLAFKRFATQGCQPPFVLHLVGAVEGEA